MATRRDGERDIIDEQERDAIDLADATTEIDAEQVEQAYRAACDEAANQQEVRRDD